MTRVHVPAHLHSADGAGGSVVVLNGRSGQWHVLNRTATALWREVARTHDVDRAITALAARHPPATRPTVHADALALVRDLTSRGLIATGRPTRTRSARRAPARSTSATGPGRRRVSVLAGIAAPAAVCLLRLPFRAAVRVVRTLNATCPTEATPEQAAEVTAAVDRALRRSPGRAACLEHSLAAALTSALLGRRVTWVLGMAPDPYRFHAWTEVGGRPVPTPDPTPLAEFTRVLSV